MKTEILISLGAEGGGRDNYVAAVETVGGIAVPAYAPDYDGRYAGLLLAGGGDVDPARYGAENLGSEGIDPVRDEKELALLRAFLAAGKPVLGICRGHQVINVGLGGTLIQHLGDDLCRFHRRTPEQEGDKVHAVYSAENSWYRERYGAVFSVNSAHHQATERLGEGLVPVLWSESGVVEAVEHPSLPLVSVQFHPERISGKHARKDAVDGLAVVERFMALCRK